MKKFIIFCMILALNLGSAWAQDWDPMNPPNSPSDRHGHNMNAMPDGRIYLFGGEGSQGEFYNDLFYFELNNWIQVTPANNPPEARRDHASWQQNNVMYVNGGKGANGPLNDLWSYDPTSNQWTEIQVSGPKPAVRQGHSVTELPDGSIMLVGGKDVGGISGLESKDAWKYNPGTQTYQQLANAPRTHSNLDAHMIDSDVLAVFGFPNLIFFYQVSQDAWGLTSTALPAVNSSCSAVADNAQGETVIFIFGGLDAQGNESNAVYELNTVTGEVTTRESMPQPTVNGACAVLPNQSAAKASVESISSAAVLLPNQSAAKASAENFKMLFFGGLSNGVPTNTTLGFSSCPHGCGGTAIPTLSEWGMIFFSILLLSYGIWVLGKQGKFLNKL